MYTLYEECSMSEEYANHSHIHSFGMLLCTIQRHS